MDQTSRDARREQLKRTSFWLPEFQPKTKDNGVGKVCVYTDRWMCVMVIDGRGVLGHAPSLWSGLWEGWRVDGN